VWDPHYLFKCSMNRQHVFKRVIFNDFYVLDILCYGSNRSVYPSSWYITTTTFDKTGVENGMMTAGDMNSITRNKCCTFPFIEERFLFWANLNNVSALITTTLLNTLSTHINNRNGLITNWLLWNIFKRRFQANLCRIY
jgi:hypothetical protein